MLAMLPPEAGEDVTRELPLAVHQTSREVVSILRVPLGVLEALREHPGLAEAERARVDRAITGLAVAAAKLYGLQARARRLGLADAPPPGPGQAAEMPRHPHPGQGHRSGG